jgi:hypothetical protein
MQRGAASPAGSDRRFGDTSKPKRVRTDAIMALDTAPLPSFRRPNSRLTGISRGNFSSAHSPDSGTQSHRHPASNLRRHTSISSSRSLRRLPIDRFIGVVWAVIATHRMFRFVRGPDTVSRSERREAEKLFARCSPIVTLRDLKDFIRQAGYNVVSETAVRDAFVPRTFGFDGTGRPLAWREAVKVLALVKRLQCREMASNPATATEAGSVLAALQAAVDERGEDPHLRASGPGSLTASSEITPADPDLWPGSARLSPRSQQQRQRRHQPLTMHALRAIVAESMGLDMAAPAGVDDKRPLGEADIETLLSGPGGKSRRHRRGHRPPSASKDAPALGIRRATPPDGGTPGAPHDYLTPAENGLQAASFGQTIGLNGTLSNGNEDVMFVSPTRLAATERSFTSPAIDDGSSGDEFSPIVTEGRRLREIIAGIQLPQPTSVKPPNYTLMHTQNVPVNPLVRQKVFPKRQLARSKVPLTLAEVEAILDAQDRKDREIEYVPRTKPNSTVSFAGITSLARVTSIESLAILGTVTTDGGGASPSQSPRNDPLARARRTIGGNGPFDARNPLRTSSTSAVSDQALSPSASIGGGASGAAKSLRRESALEREQQLTERLQQRRETLVSRELPLWKQAWKKPPQIANVPNLYRHVRSRGIDRLACTPTFSMPPDVRAATIAALTQQHRAASVMELEQQASYERSFQASYSGGYSDLDATLYDNPPRARPGLPHICSVAAAACGAMQERLHGSPVAQRRGGSPTAGSFSSVSYEHTGFNRHGSSLPTLGREPTNFADAQPANLAPSLSMGASASSYRGAGSPRHDSYPSDQQQRSNAGSPTHGQPSRKSTHQSFVASFDPPSLREAPMSRSVESYGASSDVLLMATAATEPSSPIRSELLQRTMSVHQRGLPRRTSSAGSDTMRRLLAEQRSVN